MMGTKRKWKPVGHVYRFPLVYQFPFHGVYLFRHVYLFTVTSYERTTDELRTNAWKDSGNKYMFFVCVSAMFASQVWTTPAPPPFTFKMGMNERVRFRSFNFQRTGKWTNVNGLKFSFDTSADVSGFSIVFCQLIPLSSSFVTQESTRFSEFPFTFQRKRVREKLLDAAVRPLYLLYSYPFSTDSSSDARSQRWSEESGVCVFVLVSRTSSFARALYQYG